LDAVGDAARVGGALTLAAAPIAAYQLGREVGPDQTLGEYAGEKSAEQKFLSGLRKYATAGIQIDGVYLDEIPTNPVGRDDLLTAFSNGDVAVDLSKENGLVLRLDGNSKPSFRARTFETQQTEVEQPIDNREVTESYLSFSSGGHTVDFPLAIGHQGVNELQTKINEHFAGNRTITSLVFEQRNGTSWLIMQDQYGVVAETALVHSDYYQGQDAQMDTSRFIEILGSNDATSQSVEQTPDGRPNTAGFSNMREVLIRLQEVGKVMPWGDNGLAILLPHANTVPGSEGNSGTFWVDELGSDEQLFEFITQNGVKLNGGIDKSQLTDLHDHTTVRNGVHASTMRVFVIGYPYDDSAKMYTVENWQLGLPIGELVDSMNHAPKVSDGRPVNLLYLNVEVDPDVLEAERTRQILEEIRWP
jgi:hypothetical protein